MPDHFSELFSSSRSESFKLMPKEPVPGSRCSEAMLWNSPGGSNLPSMEFHLVPLASPLHPGSSFPESSTSLIHIQVSSTDGEL